MTIPRPIRDAGNYLNLYLKRSGLLISWQQVNFFEKVSQLTPGGSVILINPGGVDYQTPFISSLTGRRVYLDGIRVLNAHGLDVEDRISVLEQIFQQGDPKILYSMMKNEGIDYAILDKDDEYTSGYLNNLFQVLIESDNYVLIKVV